MEAMRQSWTDERLDDFRGEVNRRFDEVDRRFEEVDRRFDKVDRRFDKVDAEFAAVRVEMKSGFDRMNAQFASLQRTMFQASVVFIVALLGIIATRL
jgi:hypothetical protein